MGNGEVKFSNLSPVMQGILVLLTILGMVVPATLGFVNFDKRLDMTESTVEKHITKDEMKWEDTDDEIDALKEKSHVLEISIANAREYLPRLRADSIRFAIPANCAANAH